jgi:osmotically-inducible protein OsmY
MECLTRFAALNGVRIMKSAIRGQVIAGTVAVVLASFAGWGRAQQEGVVEKAGEKIDEFGRAIRKGFENAGDSVREGFEKTRSAVHGMGVTSRVYGRLHWEKSLHSLQLLVKSEGGVVTLKGNVPDDAVRAKAVAITVDTFGVTKVIDQLNVLHPTASESSRSLDRQ